MKRTAIVMAILFAVYLLTGVAIVRPGERAVVRRFGAVVANPGPGLWIGLPWGFDRVDRVATDLVRSVRVGYEPESDFGQLLSGDHNLVDIQVQIHYTIPPAEAARFVASSDRVDGAITRTTESALAEWVSARQVDDVLLHGKAQIPTGLIGPVRDRLAPLKLGIEVNAITVSHLAPPDEAEIRNAFAAVTSAQSAIRTLEHEATTAAELQLRSARAKSFEIEQSAAARAHERAAFARADADAFRRRFEQYQKLKRSNANLLAAIWWEELGPLLGKMQAEGRIDLIDNRVGADGFDIMQRVPR